MMRVLLLSAALIICLPAGLQADSMIGTGASCQYYYDSDSFVPEFWLKTAFDLYFKLSRALTLFVEGNLFGNYNLPDDEFSSLADLSTDISYMNESFLVRWGIKANAGFTPVSSDFDYDVATNLLFSLCSDTTCFQFSPVLFYDPDSRAPLDISGKVNYTFSLFGNLILSPAIEGGINLVTEGETEYHYKAFSELDWYPGTAFFLNGNLGFEERFSANPYTVYFPDTEQVIDDYYGYREFSGLLGCDFLLGDSVTVQCSTLAAYRQMKHEVITPAGPGTDPEWQLTIKPEIRTNISLGGNFLLVFMINYLQILSNADYRQIINPGAAVELLYEF